MSFHTPASTVVSPPSLSLICFHLCQYDHPKRGRRADLSNVSERQTQETGTGHLISLFQACPLEALSLRVLGCKTLQLPWWHLSGVAEAVGTEPILSVRQLFSCRGAAAPEWLPAGGDCPPHRNYRLSFKHVTVPSQEGNVYLAGDSKRSVIKPWFLFYRTPIKVSKGRRLGVAHPCHTACSA